MFWNRCPSWPRAGTRIPSELTIYKYYGGCAACSGSCPSCSVFQVQHCRAASLHQLHTHSHPTMAALIRRLPLPLPRPEPTPGPAPATKSTLNGPENPDHDPKPTNPARRHGKVSFATLPPEIHILISRELIYPDALSLKHTSRHFYNLVDTGVKLKIDWLVERRQLHLECPNDRRCDLGSDLRFCRGSVRYVPPPRENILN